MVDTLEDRLTESPKELRAWQVVCGGLVMGVVVFAVIVLLVLRPMLNLQSDIVGQIALGLAILAALLYRPFSNIAGRSAHKMQPATQPVSHPAIPHFSTRLIIRVGMLEGAGIFNVIAFMIEGWLGSIVVAGALVGLMLLEWPTASGWHAFRERYELQHPVDELPIDER